MNLMEFYSKTCLNHLNEKFQGDKILMYTTSKSDDYDKYFNAQELKFANNAGNMYGLGIYTTLEPPEESKAGWKSDTRAELYGNNIYEFSLNSDRLVYFLYDYFVKSALFKKCGSPDESSFIEAQMKYFKLNIDADDLARITPSASRNNAKCAFAFYRLMNAEYYQRDDGTLETPIAGFVYEGKQDGLVGVIWNPYEMTMTRKNIGGEWQPIENSSKKSKANDIKARIFDGNMTDEKVKVYKLLQGTKDDEGVGGQFVHVVIHDNKTIDFTYKSLVPQADGYRHCLVMQQNNYFDEIFKMGYRFGRVDAWLKLGHSTQAVSESYTPTQCPAKYWPKLVTEGFYLSAMEITDAELAALKKHKSETGKLAIRRCKLLTANLDGFEIERLDECSAPDDVADKLMSKYDCQIKKQSEIDAEIAQKEAAKKAKEEAKRAAEEEKKRKAAEREAKKKAKEEEAAKKAAAKAAKAKK